MLLRWQPLRIIAGKGIGKRLLSHALLNLMREGARAPSWRCGKATSSAQNVSQVLAETSGRRRRYYRDNDEDAIIMSLGSLNADRLGSTAEMHRLIRRTTMDAEQD